jgi:ATP-binding cassette subfamily B protein
MEQPHEKRSTASVKDVLNAFWAGIKPYKWLSFVVVVILVAVSILQVIVPLFYKHFFDILSKSTDRAASSPELLHTLFIILCVNGFIWLLYRSVTILALHLQARIIATLKQQAFDYMIEHSYSFFANSFTGSLVQRINRFARAFDVLSDRLLWNVIPLVIQITGISIVLWFTKPLITGLIIIWVVIFGLFNLFFSRWKVKYDIKLAALDSKTTGVLSDNITTQNTVQLFTGYAFEQENYKNITNEQARMNIFTWNLSGIIDAVQSSLIFISEFLLFYFALKYWKLGVISIGSFVLIQAYFLNLGARLWDVSRIFRNVYEGFADAKEMVDIMIKPHDVKDIPQAQALVVSNGNVEYENVVFKFNETREVVKNINLKIPGGQKVAIIGPSGAGKSTFVRLLLRFYNVTTGAIYIDGQNIQKVTQESLRKNVSLVPQDPVLFHRSLKENIRYGKRDATDEEVFEAAQQAHCHEFIKDLPLGYETLVGERGIKLSGGERQRVAIARAILKNAPILILDEATSSLDSESEHLIQDALETLMKGKTVIVIAHRLSTIRKMDRIVVIEEGRVREEGSHDELLTQRDSLYGKLWNLQAGGFIPAVSEEAAQKLK